MSRIKPYAGTSQMRLAALIRRAQEPPLPADVSFSFGMPVPGEIPVPGATVVDATALYVGRFEDPIPVNYKRLSGDVLNELPPGELLPFNPMLFPTSIHAILPQINEALGLNLLVIELEDTVLDTPPVNGITLIVKPNSLAWLPGEYTYRYAPSSQQPAARNADYTIPTDELRRIRVLELPVAS